MMTSKERLLGLLSHRTTDRAGWAPVATVTFFTGQPDYVKRFGNNDWLPSTPALIEDELRYRVKTYRNVGADFMGWMTGLCATEPDSMVKVNQARKENEIFTEVTTPLGSISERKEISDAAHGVFTKKEFISAPREIDIYRFWIEHSPVRADYNRLNREMEIVGEDGVLLAAGPTAPIQTLELHGCKLDDLVYFLADYHEKIEKLFSAMHGQELAKARIAADSGCPVFLSSYVIGCGTLSPEMFDLYVKGKSKEYHEILHGKGKLSVSHSSGEDLFPLWDFMEAIKLDAIHGFSTKPARNQDLARILRTYGKNITIWGGLDPDFLYHGSIPEISEAVKRVLDVALASQVPFILGSSDDLVPGTPLKNLEAVSQIVDRMKY